MDRIASQTDLPGWLRQQMRSLVLEHDRLLSEALGHLALVYFRTQQATTEEREERSQEVLILRPPGTQEGTNGEQDASQLMLWGANGVEGILEGKR